MSVKVISWCLFEDEANLNRWPEYLAGMRANQRAARFWFPGWKLRLYISDNLSKETIDFIEKVNLLEPSFEIVKCRAQSNPMIERYRPLWEDGCDVCIARDIDSVLSKTDADYVNDWLNDDESDVLCYREYLMKYKSVMGGGIGVKTTVLRDKGVNLYDSQMGRGYDETSLFNMLQEFPELKCTEVVTRMMQNGVYCIYKPEASPSETQVLWVVPFFEMSDGYVNPNEVCWNDKEATTLWCLNTYRIQREVVGSHWFHHNLTLTSDRWWIR